MRSLSLKAASEYIMHRFAAYLGEKVVREKEYRSAMMASGDQWKLDGTAMDSE